MHSGFPILSLLLWLPLLGAFAILMIPSREKGLIRNLALGFSLVDLAIAIFLFHGFSSDDVGRQFVEKWSLINGLGVSYHLGMDGLSLLLVLLTAFLSPIVILSTYKAIDDRVKEFFFSLQLLQVGVLGSFLSMDVFLFYVFWELMLIPMYLLIGVWGGQRRVYAAVKFFLYTLVGSVLMLVAIIWVYLEHYKATGNLTADLFTLYGTKLSGHAQMLCFAAFALAFAIKVPMFPFHTWLPDAHVEAPTAGSVILAAVLLKLGTYGFLRFAYPLFPEAAAFFGPYIAVLAVIGIVYGALVAMVQPDVKKLIAYSSVSHLGFIMLGIVALTPMTVSGSLLQMVNHGISTGLLFLLVGVIYERRHTRLITEFGGLAKQLPWFSLCFMVATLASIGLPGTNGFVGEFLVMLGTFNSSVLDKLLGGRAYTIALTTVAGLGIILGAVYMLWMVQRVFFGPLSKDENRRLKDMNLREAIVVIPMIIIIFLIGLFPNLFLGKVQRSVDHFVGDIGRRAGIIETVSNDTKHKADKLVLDSPEAKHDRDH
ncbi:MAG: NADH-quinone oxidoreductase subunit M [Deltaproteobacteria bacterium]|nr:NADH-quinone oxidoreductase subunit M [Deltaproteobacteria bacterium]